MQAFLLYEDELTDSKAQIRALSCMVGALLRTRNFDEGDYDALCTKVRRSVHTLVCVVILVDMVVGLRLL